MEKFNYDQDFKKLNFKQSPELYRVGRGEQGVLLIEPYKSEILPHWRFKTPADAKKSSQAILDLFHHYLKDMDFAGMDMARKFLQMGYTRSRRYANHKSGKKYDGMVPVDKKGQSGAHGREILPRELDLEKAKSAEIFWKAWQRVEKNAIYKELKDEWRVWYG